MGLDRRKLLTSGGAAAAAAVGATALSASPAAAATFSPLYLPVGPIRVYDSREGLGRIYRNQERSLTPAAPDPDVIAECYNLTVTETAGAGGYIAVFPDDELWDGTSSINWFGPNQTLANNALTRLSQVNGGVAVRCGGTSGASTQFVLDLIAEIRLVDLDALNSSALLARDPTVAESRQLHDAE